MSLPSSIHNLWVWASRVRSKKREWTADEPTNERWTHVSIYIFGDTSAWATCCLHGWPGNLPPGRLRLNNTSGFLGGLVRISLCGACHALVNGAVKRNWAYDKQARFRRLLFNFKIRRKVVVSFNIGSPAENMKQYVMLKFLLGAYNENTSAKHKFILRTLMLVYI